MASNIPSKITIPSQYNCLIILGPTAVGKTAVGVRLADYFGGEVICADSRQVYKGLDVGSGKDYQDFILPADTGSDFSYSTGEAKPEHKVRYNLMDVTDLSHEYSVFDYQMDFYKVFTDLQKRNVLPVIVGGTGMYLDSIVRGYDLIPVPTNEKLRKELAGKSISELASYLENLKASHGDTLHNHTDTEERHRLLRAIEIEVYSTSPEKKEAERNMPQRPDIRPLIIGTTFPRPMLRAGIKKRMEKRFFQQDMTAEVEELHKSAEGVPEGVSWERLERLGLEYRFISEFLQGKIASKEELFSLLCTAICQFAKRQETWYRGMEKKGVQINWLPHDGSYADSDINRRVEYALHIIAQK